MTLASTISAGFSAVANAVNLKADKLMAINAKTANYTLILSDANKTVEMSNGAARTITIPPNSTAAFPIGTQLLCRQTGAGLLSIVAGAGVTVNSRGGVLSSGGQWGVILLTKRAINTWVLDGDLA